MKRKDARHLAPQAQEAIRMRAVEAVRGGMSQTDAARIFGVTRRAVSQWMQRYRTGGTSALKARKRAAAAWGIGRYLYAVESPWVELDESGKHISRKELARLHKLLSGSTVTDAPDHAEPEPEAAPHPAPAAATPFDRVAWTSRNLKAAAARGPRQLEDWWSGHKDEIEDKCTKQEWDVIQGLYKGLVEKRGAQGHVGPGNEPSPNPTYPPLPTDIVNREPIEGMKVNIYQTFLNAHNALPHHPRAITEIWDKHGGTWERHAGEDVELIDWIHQVRDHFLGREAEAPFHE